MPKMVTKIHLAMFYIADREVVEALTDAAKRGVKIEMILDPNQNAFGSEKSGCPIFRLPPNSKNLGMKTSRSAGIKQIKNSSIQN